MNDLKYTEASFSPILTTDIQTDCFTPCACAQSNNYIATLDNTCNYYYPLTAIPRYPGVTAIKQYMYSDSAVVDIECPFQIGRLRELYEFSWDGVIGPGDVQPIPNGTVGVYWLAEEDNRTLHVNISATSQILKELQFQCVGEVTACRTSSSCEPVERNSPTINITTTAGMHVCMVTGHAVKSLSLVKELAHQTSISTQAACLSLCLNLYILTWCCRSSHDH